MSRSVRSQMYAAARFLGDVQAASKGPGAYVRRVARKRAYRATNTGLGRVLRATGLMRWKQSR